MKKKIRYNIGKDIAEKEVTYIPVRYIFAVLITLLEIASIIAIVVAMCYFVPYFYILAWATVIGCVIKIVASDDNPDYKIPWLIIVIAVPVAGFMIYFIFSSRKLKKKFVKRLNAIKESLYRKNDQEELDELKQRNPYAFTQAKMLCNIAQTHLFTKTKQAYFPLGEDMHERLIFDLKRAKSFIFMEYFIIEEGKFWDSILEVLKERASQGVEIKVVYDDIGCMSTLPGNYAKQLRKFGIEATPFSRLKGSADSEFNNRSHRKITVIDGYIGYTGGVNIADEYINAIEKYGHWKDTAIRIEGEAVWELTNLFLTDYYINVPNPPQKNDRYYPSCEGEQNGYLIPFGDGPNPLYKCRVGKSVIQNMLNSATNYAYMTTPYLIIDNDLCTTIENTARRGVDVRIIVPHIPDKKIVFNMTRSYYNRLMNAGVKIYEYKPGFIHAKSYLVDDKYAMIGTINLDYRSLVHHFENGVWMYECDSIKDIKKDIDYTMNKSILITKNTIKTNWLQSFMRSIVRLFAPML